MDNSQQEHPFGRPFEPPAPAQPPDPHHQTRRERQEHRRKLLLFAIGGAVVAVGVLVAVYLLFLRGDSSQTAQQATNPQTSQEQQPASQPAVSDATPQTYKSEKLNIELTHRKDWTVKESSGSEVTVTSPAISYVASNGQATTGVFTVKIRKGVTDAIKTTIDNAVAPRDSQVIAYAAPTDQQRQYTNLSYGGTKDAFKFFIITGNAEFKAGTAFMYALPLDSEFYLITGGYGADRSGNLSFDIVPKDSMDSQALTQAISIVESLKIY